MRYLNLNGVPEEDHQAHFAVNSYMRECYWRTYADLTIQRRELESTLPDGHWCKKRLQVLGQLQSKEIVGKEATGFSGEYEQDFAFRLTGELWHHLRFVRSFLDEDRWAQAYCEIRHPGVPRSEVFPCTVCRAKPHDNLSFRVEPAAAPPKTDAASCGVCAMRPPTETPAHEV